VRGFAEDAPDPRPAGPTRSRQLIRLGPMDLEEKSIERPGDRCEECGAKLTPQEIEAVLESGGPALCSIHADEVVPIADDESEFGEQ
jgi:hypothetical protein